MFRKACLPDIRYKDTKNGKSLDRIYKKVSIKYRNKKRADGSFFICCAAVDTVPWKIVCIAER